MTQEHRDQFLAMEGWQKTERGYIRTERFFAVPDSIYAPPLTYYYVTSFEEVPSRKFRRFPFGRQPKHDALVGWFVLEPEEVLERGGGLRELNEMAGMDAKNNGNDSERHVGKFDWILDGWLYHNKRQGWDKYGEVMG